MPDTRKTRRHIALRDDLRTRVERRLALTKALTQRTRMMIARLDRQLGVEAPPCSKATTTVTHMATSGS